jgi:hypothetical protein
MTKRWSAMPNRPIRLSMIGGLATALLFSISACNWVEVKGAELRVSPTLQSVQRDFVDRACLRCHVQSTTANRNVDLTDIARLVEKAGHHHGDAEHTRFLIKPGCPKQSLFLSIIREGKMPPPPAPRISAENINAIAEYITSLDPKANCESDEPPDDDDDDSP